MAGLWAHAQRFDAQFTAAMARHSFTNDLIHNPVSRTITETLFVAFVVLLTYETLYWSGIYLGLWEYHAKEIFKEVPVHCAHVYVRINLARKADAAKVRQYYLIKQESSYNIMNWKKLDALGQELFLLKQFVKYHFEFSPEDFENNPDPELGSTIEHLRQRILHTFNESAIRSKVHPGKDDLTVGDVLVFNNKSKEVGPAEDKTYLSKIHIETGNVIDSIILL